MWSCSALLAIQSRGRSNYLTGEAEEPKLEDLSHSQWISGSSFTYVLVASFHVTEINCNLLLLSTAHNICTV